MEEARDRVVLNLTLFSLIIASPIKLTLLSLKFFMKKTWLGEDQALEE